MTQKAPSGDPVAADVWMAVMLSREIRPHDVVGVGLASPLAALAALMRRKEDPSVTLIMQSLVNPVGTLRECSLGIDSLRERASAWLSHSVLLSLTEAGDMGLQFMRPAQVDQFGNLNTSRVARSDGTLRYLPGGMAQADTTVLMRRIVAYHPDHRLRSFPARVDFITGSGKGMPHREPPRDGVIAVVTDRAVIRFEPEGARVQALRPGGDRAELRAHTGFALRDAESAPEVAPTAAEIAAAVELDPDNLRLLEFPSLRQHALQNVARTDSA